MTTFAEKLKASWTPRRIDAELAQWKAMLEPIQKEVVRVDLSSPFAKRVRRAWLGLPSRLDFRVAVGITAFAGWASGRLRGVGFPYPHCAVFVSGAYLYPVRDGVEYVFEEEYLDVE